jgi:hypothetical protein
MEAKTHEKKSQFQLRVESKKNLLYSSELLPEIYFLICAKHIYTHSYIPPLISDKQKSFCLQFDSIKVNSIDR